MSVLSVVVAAAGFFAGGVAIGAVGFGSVLVAAPLVALVAPRLIPFVFVVPTLVTDTFVAWRERAALDGALLRRFVVWQLPGALAGAWLLARIDRPELLGLAVGALVLLLVGFQMTPWRVRRTPAREVAAASLAGFSGALSGVNGPPVAVLVADEPPPLIRATLPAFFVVAQPVLVASWVLAGAFELRPLLVGALAAPAMQLGAVVGQRLATRITPRAVRWSVLVLSLAATGRGLVAIAA